jgi:hypothetical protein
VLGLNYEHASTRNEDVIDLRRAVVQWQRDVVQEVVVRGFEHGLQCVADNHLAMMLKAMDAVAAE